MHAKHQVIFDLSNVPIGERVTPGNDDSDCAFIDDRSVAFFVNKRTELLTSWLLFPENLPYSTTN